MSYDSTFLRACSYTEVPVRASGVVSKSSVSSEALCVEWAIRVAKFWGGLFNFNSQR